MGKKHPSSKNAGTSLISAREVVSCKAAMHAMPLRWRILVARAVNVTPLVRYLYESSENDELSIPGAC